MIVLKPCCLPIMIHAERGELFEAGGHSFPAKEVCAHGKWVAKSKGSYKHWPK